MNYPECRSLPVDLPYIYNSTSPEMYQRMELEKKKARSVKSAYRGPMVRYHSVTMPLIEELPAEAEINVVTDANGDGG